MGETLRKESIVISLNKCKYLLLFLVIMVINPVSIRAFGESIDGKSGESDSIPKVSYNPDGRYSFEVSDGNSYLSNMYVREVMKDDGSYWGFEISGEDVSGDVTIPSRIRTGNDEYSIRPIVGVGDFSDCRDLTSVYIPSGVEYIGDRLHRKAFSGCSNLSSIKIPESVTSIVSGSFSECTSLKDIEIPEGVTVIGNDTFFKCASLSSIEIPEGVTTIGGNAFSGCTSLGSVKIPEGVTAIKDWTFNNCASLSDVEIPGSVTTIGWGAFSGCTSLSGIEIPEGVTTIGWDAFSGCTSLSSIEIPEGVTTIGDGAFLGCAGLSSIEIPEGVESIGSNLVNEECVSLNKIINNSNAVLKFSSGNGFDHLPRYYWMDEATLMPLDIWNPSIKAKCTVIRSHGHIFSCDLGMLYEGRIWYWSDTDAYINVCLKNENGELIRRAVVGEVKATETDMWSHDGKGQFCFDLADYETLPKKYYVTVQLRSKVYLDAMHSRFVETVEDGNVIERRYEDE